MSRILLLLDHRENRRLLEQVLAARNEVLPPDSELETDFDLCVLDGRALGRLWEAVRARRQAEQPRFLPFLLITSRRDVGMTTRHLWKTVDELLYIPIEQLELQARVEILLKARRSSIALEAARQRAEVSEQVKASFLAMMSHELRSPLNAVIGFTGILLKRLSGPLTPKQEEQLNMVLNSSRHLLGLIDDLLDVVRLEGGQLRLEAQPLDLRALLHAVVGMVRPEAEKKGLALALDVDPGVEEVVGDEKRLRQVLLNLLGNAVKYTAAGTVTLAARLDGEAVELSVTDTGMGIAAADREAVFEPFHRVDREAVRNTRGAGLGLAISRRLVEMMEGRLTVDSTEGKGSTFTVRLPRRVAAAAGPPVDRRR